MRARRGSTLYLVVGGTAVLFGASAWVVDLGLGLKERSRMQAAADAGATAAIQPGGAIRDEEVIKAADERGMAMVFTGIRHFKH